MIRTSSCRGLEAARDEQRGIIVTAERMWGKLEKAGFAGNRGEVENRQFLG